MSLTARFDAQLRRGSSQMFGAIGKASRLMQGQFGGKNRRRRTPLSWLLPSTTRAFIMAAAAAIKPLSHSSWRNIAITRTIDTGGIPGPKPLRFSCLQTRTPRRCSEQALKVRSTDPSAVDSPAGSGASSQAPIGCEISRLAGRKHPFGPKILGVSPVARYPLR